MWYLRWPNPEPADTSSGSGAARHIGGFKTEEVARAYARKLAEADPTAALPGLSWEPMRMTPCEDPDPAILAAVWLM